MRSSGRNLTQEYFATFSLSESEAPSSITSLPKPIFSTVKTQERLQTIISDEEMSVPGALGQIEVTNMHDILDSLLLEDNITYTDLILNLHGYTEEKPEDRLLTQSFIYIDDKSYDLGRLICIIGHLGFRSFELNACKVGRDLDRGPRRITTLTEGEDEKAKKGHNILYRGTMSYPDMPIIINSGKFDILCHTNNLDIARIPADFLQNFFPENIVSDRYKTAISRFFDLIIHSPETRHFIIGDRHIKLSGPKINKSEDKPKITIADAEQNIKDNIAKFIIFCQENIEGFPIKDPEALAQEIFEMEIKENPRLVIDYYHQAFLIELLRGKPDNFMAYFHSETDLNYDFGDGTRILHMLSESKPETIKCFLSYSRANSSPFLFLPDSHGHTPLHRLCLSNYDEDEPSKHQNIAQLFLLSPHLNIDHQNLRDETALHLAVQFDRYDLLELILDHYADPNIKTYETQQTPLHEAVIKNKQPAIEILCADEDINLDQQDFDDATALHLAINSRYTDAAATILGSGANPNIRKNNGQTSLHIAVLKNDIELVRLLLTAKADPTIECNLGKNAIDLARESENDEILSLFSSHDSEKTGPSPAKRVKAAQSTAMKPPQSHKNSV